MPNNTDSSNPIEANNPTDFWSYIKNFFRTLVDLRKGMDRKGTLENIHTNKKMQGANAWLLMCSIMVASIGLDLNSPAVIIGAMLISPLMSPILGIGLGIGVNDKKTLVISLQHFGIAIAIALITSYIYFRTTPFGNITKEIASRTEPTLLDGLVAIFGGLAGVISITRKDKSNAIPGVAIATALMPPLCVAGFGLAKEKWDFFLNAFYLFFLNSFFIAITTYLIVRILNFPYKKYLNAKERNRGRFYILIFSVIILIPAIIILLDTVQKVREKQQVDNYLKKKLQDDDTILSDWTFVKESNHKKGDPTKLILKIIGEPIKKEFLSTCDQELEKILKRPIEIIPYQSQEIPIDNIQQLQSGQGDLEKRLHKLENLQTERIAHLEALIAQIDSSQTTNLTEVYNEVKTLFPLVDEIGIAKDVTKTDFSSTSEIPVVFFKWNTKKNRTEQKADLPKLQSFITQRLKLDSVQVVVY